MAPETRPDPDAPAATPAGDGALRRLVLCADDYACAPGVSQGILDLARAGRISATSAMVLSPRWPEDARRLREAGAAIDVGLHLDWTSGFAIDAGHGRALGQTMLRAMAGGFHTAQARGEIARQLDRFETHWGAPPDHVDGHQHVQQFAGIRQALVRELAGRYSARRPWLRVSHLDEQSGLKGRIINALGATALRTLARSAAVPALPHLAGAYDFGGTAAGYAQRMNDWLAQARPGTVIMCHPACRPDEGDAIAAARGREHDFLASDAFAAMLAHHRVRLVRGAELLETLP